MMDPSPDRTPLRIWIVELFAFGNLTFLSVDIYLAHSINLFAHWAEWIPVFYSITVPFVLLPGIIKRQHRRGVYLHAGYVVGVTSVLVGISGMLLHLTSGFFAMQTLKSLVYAAPFAGPLSYTGVGLLLILNRMESSGTPAWGAWVVFLAMCGFVGNFALSLLDHAQNGFFMATEWIPVIASAFGISFLLVAVSRQVNRPFLKACVIVMGVQILVGAAGFVLHLIADIKGPAPSLTQNIIYGAPVFAPLLFANLAILALVGLWEMMFLQKQADLDLAGSS